MPRRQLSLFRLLLLLSPLGGVGDVAAAAPESHFAVVADAGSTGTRAYAFELPSGTGEEKPSRVKIHQLGKGPALSSFQDHPQDSVDAVRAQLGKARELIPQQFHSSVPVLVLATAGMRLLDPQKATAIYDGLREALLRGDFAFSRDALEVRTISGWEEGAFAFVAANYLSKRIDVDLNVRNEALMGVLDLGGSSTQIAVPPAAVLGEDLLPKLRSMFSKSFLSYGMERMRQLTYAKVTSEAHWAQRLKGAAANPCAFEGHVEEGAAWRGVGDAMGCQRIITAILHAEKKACGDQHSPMAATRHRTSPGSKGHSCLPMELVKSARGPVTAQESRFFLISGYHYVIDFARWWLQQPNVVPDPSAGSEEDSGEEDILRSLAVGSEAFSRPSLPELRAAAAILCAEPWARIRSKAIDADGGGHKYTPEHKVSHRCFEINYVISLLGLGFGFPQGARPFRVVDVIGDSDLEWTLGAFLVGRRHGSAGGGSGPHAVVLPKLQAPPPADFMRSLTAVVFFAAIALIFVVYVLVAKRCRPDGYGKTA